MALEKVRITIEHTGVGIDVMFNPEEYTVNKDNNFASQGIPGRSGPLLQFVQGNMRTLEMELLFDTYEQRRDVREETQRIVKLLDIDSALHAPPVLRVSWGSLQFRCVLARVSQKFQMFRDDGRPVRARLTVTFNEFLDLDREAKEVNRQTADFSKAHVVTEGETLSGIAAKLYDNAQMWRPIAIVNEIDDPRSIAAGQTLRIPSLPFVNPDTGEVLQ
ncbi:LysM peptidoglycan-binding domain-containing protein [Candidatus Acetothermia bacterium]|nr:LysM peptidoglycan-binding domain-containing protein [Candidatus Acetothermia bacterium]